MPNKIGVRLISSGIASIIFALIVFMRVRWIGNNITIQELSLWLILCGAALIDAAAQFAKLYKLGLAFTPIDEIINNDQKNKTRHK